MTGMIVAGLVGVPWRVVALLAAVVLVWAVIGFASIGGDEQEDADLECMCSGTWLCDHDEDGAS